jgi:hypothetical protein
MGMTGDRDRLRRLSVSDCTFAGLIPTVCENFAAKRRNSAQHHANLKTAKPPGVRIAVQRGEFARKISLLNHKFLFVEQKTVNLS